MAHRLLVMHGQVAAAAGRLSPLGPHFCLLRVEAVVVEPIKEQTGSLGHQVVMEIKMLVLMAWVGRVEMVVVEAIGQAVARGTQATVQMPQMVQELSQTRS